MTRTLSGSGLQGLAGGEHLEGLVLLEGQLSAGYKNPLQTHKHTHHKIAHLVLSQLIEPIANNRDASSIVLCSVAVFLLNYDDSRYLTVSTFADTLPLTHPTGSIFQLFSPLTDYSLPDYNYFHYLTMTISNHYLTISFT